MGRKNFKLLLNWSKIVRDVPDKEIKKNGKRVNRGLRFENLIEKLLAAMFGEESWRRTQESNDGKRDFVRPYDVCLIEREWAECKNYKDALSINVISPTLLMGTLEGINSIYFFSRTPLNDNALESILRYSRTTGMVIRIIDGELLEAFILKYWEANGIKDFFYTSPDKSFSVKDKFDRASKVKVIKILRDMQGNRISQKKVFETGEFFYISIITRNLSTNPEEYDFYFRYNTNILSITDSSIPNKIYLAPGEIKEMSFLCSAVQSGNTSIKITLARASQIFENKIVRVSIDDEIFNFWDEKNAFSSVDTCINHLTNFKTMPLLITGKGGTGKSTLLNIIRQHEEINQKYRLIKIDHNTRHEIYRNVLYSCTGMYEADIPAEQQEEETALTNLLFNCYVTSARQLALAILKLHCGDRPFLFLFDDAHKIGRGHREIIRQLIKEADLQNIKLYFIFAINTDQEDNCSSFLNEMNWSEIYNDVQVKEVQLNKYDANDIIRFLKHKYGLEGFEYCFQDFDKEVTPLELNRFAEDLKYNEIICKMKNGIYRITDILKFKNAVYSSLYANFSIVGICSSLRSDMPEFVLKYLYIVGELPLSAHKEFAAAIKTLHELSLIKYLNENIVIAHDKIRESVGLDLTFSDEEYADIFDDKYCDEYGKAYCALNLSKLDREKVDFLNNFFSKSHKNISASKRYELCNAIIKNFDRLQIPKLKEQAINFVRENIPALNREQGHDGLFSFFALIANTALTCNWDFEGCPEIMAWLMKKVLDRALSTYHSAQCLNYAKAFIGKLLSVSEMPDNRKYYWLSHYYNRAAIAMERKYTPTQRAEYEQEITRYYRFSRQYCERAEYPEELLLQILVDDFNIHYVYSHDLTYNQVTNYLKRLEKINIEKIERELCYQYHNLLYRYMQIRLKPDNSHLKILNEIKCDVETQLDNLKGKSAFYVMKLYLLCIYLNIELKNHKQAHAVTLQALDYAYLHEMRSFIYKLTFIRSFLIRFDESLSDNPNDRQDLPVLAFKQLLDAKSRNEADIIREIYTARELLSLIWKNNADYAKSLIPAKNELFKKLGEHICGKTRNEIFELSGYFVFDGVHFPPI